MVDKNKTKYFSILCNLYISTVDILSYGYFIILYKNASHLRELLHQYLLWIRINSEQ